MSVPSIGGYAPNYSARTQAMNRFQAHGTGKSASNQNVRFGLADGGCISGPVCGTCCAIPCLVPIGLALVALWKFARRR